MRFFLISDNSDAMNGLRLAGIEGTVARSEADLRQALENAAKQPDIAVLLVTEKIAETYTEVLDSARAKGTPLLITVPSTGGGAAPHLKKLVFQVHLADKCLYQNLLKLLLKLLLKK